MQTTAPDQNQPTQKKRKFEHMLGAPSLEHGCGKHLHGLPGVHHSHSSILEEETAARRRMAEALRDLKVVHLPMEIAGNMQRITSFLRGQGVDVTSVNYYDTWLKYQCDVNLALNTKSPQEQTAIVSRFVRKAMDEYDIFHFHFGQSLFPDLRDLEELKARDKKIIFHFWGSDMRSMEWLIYQFARFLGHNPPPPYSYNLDHYAKIKKINIFADVMLGGPFIPRYVYIPGNIDTANWTLEQKAAAFEARKHQKDPNKVYVLHAPSDELKKGSRIIMDLLERCKQKGMPLETILVKGIPHAQVKELYAVADVAVDNVTAGTFGLLGTELMCWQVPVMVYKNDWWDVFRDYPPVVGITRENFMDQMADLTGPEGARHRREIGERSREWVLHHVDIASWCGEYLRLYEHLAAGVPVPHFQNPNWYVQENALQNGRKSDFFRFMIDQGVFAEMGINVDNYDTRIYT